MHVKFLVFVLVALFGCQVSGYAREKPDYLPTCHKQETEENFIKCSTNAVQKLFTKIAEGIPEIKLPPTDPLHIESINILQGDGPVSVNASLSNITVYGFGKTKVLFNSVDPKNYDWLTKIYLPSMRIEGNYELAGRILVVPMRGHGKCWFEMSEVNIITNTDVDLYQKDEFSFYNVTGTHVKYNIGNLKLYMGNLFDGIKLLERTTNEFLNENWRPAAESLRPVLEATIEDILLKLMKHIFDQVPADFFVDDIAVPV